MPKRLDVTYDNALERIRGQIPNRAELAQRALVWITFAKVQLPIGALQHALAVTSKGASTDIADDKLVDPERLVSLCSGLVTIDYIEGIIRPVHYTAQKFLESHFSYLYNPTLYPAH